MPPGWLPQTAKISLSPANLLIHLHSLSAHVVSSITQTAVMSKQVILTRDLMELAPRQHRIKSLPSSEGVFVIVCLSDANSIVIPTSGDPGIDPI